MLARKGKTPVDAQDEHAPSKHIHMAAVGSQRGLFPSNQTLYSQRDEQEAVAPTKGADHRPRALPQAAANNVRSGEERPSIKSDPDNLKRCRRREKKCRSASYQLFICSFRRFFFVFLFIYLFFFFVFLFFILSNFFEEKEAIVLGLKF